MTERVEVPFGGIDIANAIARKHPAATMVHFLVDGRVDGKGELSPIRVTIDPGTWEITCEDPWRPIVVDGLVTALERDSGPEDGVSALHH